MDRMIMLVSFSWKTAKHVAESKNRRLLLATNYAN